MNERIKLMARQSGATDQNGGMATTVFCFTEMELDNFAELIVRECMNIADGQKKYVEEMEVYNLQDEVWNRARIQQSQQIVDKIKQHVGVEE